MIQSPRISCRNDEVRVSLQQPHEITYWTHEFEVTERELKEAVNRVGDLATNVERYLEENKGATNDRFKVAEHSGFYR